MTKEEFNAQVWRRFDSIITADGYQRRVARVSMETFSVMIRITPEVSQWYKCDDIVSHISVCNEATDAEIIEGLHEKIMKLEKRVEDQQAIIDTQNEKLAVDPSAGLKNLRRFVTEVRDALASKQKRMSRADAAIAGIHKWLDEKGVPRKIEEEES